jgi:biotin carboxyl carrier protein
MSVDRCELRVVREGDAVRLASPGVGLFTHAVPAGRALSGGDVAGVLLTLGRAVELIVPDGVAGVVESTAPEAVHAPVAFATVLYRLAPLRAGPAAASRASESSRASGALHLRSPSSGRFWHRTSPSDPALVQAGDVLERGRAVGLIEVMKTFTLVHYAPDAQLPARARVLRVLAADGAEVTEKAALLELEPA